MGSGVDSKFGEGEVFIPVVLLSACIQTEVFLDFLVGSFGLSVGLGVIRSSEVGLDTELLKEGAHNLRGKLGPSIANKPEREAMKSEDLVEVDVGYAFGGNVGCTG